MLFNLSLRLLVVSLICNQTHQLFMASPPPTTQRSCCSSSEPSLGDNCILVAQRKWASRWESLPKEVDGAIFSEMRWRSVEAHSERDGGRERSDGGMDGTSPGNRKFISDRPGVEVTWQRPTRCPPLTEGNWRLKLTHTQISPPPTHTHSSYLGRGQLVSTCHVSE